MLPPEEWHNPNWPTAPWAVEDIDFVVTDAGFATPSMAIRRQANRGVDVSTVKEIEDFDASPVSIVPDASHR